MERVVWLSLIAERTSLEVGGWKPHLLGVAACVAILNGDTYIHTESSVSELMSSLASADRIVGYNLTGFDLKVLSAYGPVATLQNKVVDIAVELERALQFRLPLDNLLGATLNRQRIMDSVRQEQMWREGLCLDAISACYEDTANIKALYEHAVQTGALSYFDPHGSERRELPFRCNWILTA